MKGEERRQDERRLELMKMERIGEATDLQKRGRGKREEDGEDTGEERKGEVGRGEERREEEGRGEKMRLEESRLERRGDWR